MENIKQIANRIKKLCEEKNVSINQMLSECDAGQRTYHNMCAGSIPSIDKIDKIADYFNVSIDYIVGRTDEPNINTRNNSNNAFYEIAAFGGTETEGTQKPIVEETT